MAVKASPRPAAGSRKKGRKCVNELQCYMYMIKNIKKCKKDTCIFSSISLIICLALQNKAYAPLAQLVEQ